MTLIAKACIAALLLAAPAASLAQNDCPGARDDYTRSVEEIERTLRLYARCISGSGGRNDCMLEFKQLEKAQKRFDQEILNMRFRCNGDRNMSRGGDPDQG